jgi:hypothetical protein
MKRMLIAVALLCLPSLAVGAPPDSTDAAIHPNSLRAGAWALQFDVNGQLLSIDSFAGGVSLKRHFSPKAALRFGVGVSLRDREMERDDVSGDRELSDELQSVRIETVYQRYVNPGAVVNANWGIGPFANYDRMNASSATDSTDSSTKRTAWNMGVMAILGAEWFFVRQFSLHAEFLASAFYSTETAESAGHSGGFAYENKSESDGWSVQTENYVRLGLSAYF